MTTSRRPRLPLTFVVGLGDRYPAPEPAPLQPPPVDVVEVDGGWCLVFEIPGALPDRLVIEVRGRLVSVRGERRTTEGECGRFLRVERASGPFERAVELPDELDPEGASAAYMDGLLTLKIRKRAAPKGRTIPIRRGAAHDR